MYVIHPVRCMQVEPNAHKIEEHRRKYDRLRKEREDRKAERERQRRKAEAQVDSHHPLTYMSTLMLLLLCYFMYLIN